MNLTRTMNWIRSADPRACAIRGALYFGFGSYGVYLVIVSPSIAAYGIILVGALGIVINIAAIMKRN